MKLNLKFIEGAASYDTAKVFLARIDPQISSTDELLKSMYYLLWFPSYFGFNWNALEDLVHFHYFYQKSYLNMIDQSDDIKNSAIM